MTVHPPRRARFPVGAVALLAVLLLGGGPPASPPTAPPTAASPPAAPREVTATPPLPAARPVHLRIAAIGVDSPLVDLGLAVDGTLQVPADGGVAGWFTGGPAPGTLGPAVVAGHVDWDHEPGVFSRLRELRNGDGVDVARRDGTTVRFTVLTVEQYAKDAFPTERVYGDIDHAGLRLITCGGEFDRAARSYRDNVVVYAGLVASPG